MSIFARGRDENAYLRAAGLGAVTGLRSMLPLALLAAAVNPGGPLVGYTPSRGDGLAARVFGSKAALILFGLMAAGELVADKLPFVPGRIEPPVLGERLVVGALVGAASGDLGGRSPLVGALIGAATSGTVAALGYYGRTTLARVTPLPQQAWGVVEDGLAVVLGLKTLGLQRR